MTVETDEDLANMFDTDDFAEDATYTPTVGDPVVVQVVVSRGRQFVNVGFSGVTATKRTAFARKAQIADPKRGETLTTATETLTIQTCNLDEQGVLWQLGMADT